MKTIVTSNSRSLLRAFCALSIGVAALWVIPASGLAVASVPEPSPWGVIALSGVASLGMIMLRKKRRTTLLVGAAALATSANAQTTTFDFGQPPTGSPPAGVYFINSAATFTSLFGTGTTGASFTAQGLYQETNTTTKNIANVGTSSATPALLMDYAQNSSPSARLVFTNFGTVSTPDAPFNGFALSGNPGQGGGHWQYVQTLSTSSTSPNSFTYQVGGVGTQFALNSIGVANLQNGGPGSVTIEGFLNGQLVATQLLNPITAVGGNGLAGPPPVNASVQIFTLAGFGDVDTVEILNASGTAGVLANVNDIAISPVPEPSTWAMFVIGFASLGLLGSRRARFSFRRRIRIFEQ